MLELQLLHFCFTIIIDKCYFVIYEIHWILMKNIFNDKKKDKKTFQLLNPIFSSATTKQSKLSAYVVPLLLWLLVYMY